MATFQEKRHPEPQDHLSAANAGVGKAMSEVI